MKKIISLKRDNFLNQKLFPLQNNFSTFNIFQKLSSNFSIKFEKEKISESPQNLKTEQDIKKN